MNSLIRDAPKIPIQLKDKQIFFLCNIFNATAFSNNNSDFTLLTSITTYIYIVDFFLLAC